MSGARGSLCLVLHTHMPYVEGFGTWPFGEEWLWEATATCYLPLLDVLDAAPGRLTVSVTPVLADQWAAMAGAAGGRFEAFLRELRPESHRRDVAWASDPAVAAALEASAAAYAGAAEAFDRRGRDLLTGFAPHAAWTSAATHAILPLLATDDGVRLQLATGVAAHRARFGAWQGGLWLPECAYAGWLDPLLAQAGVRACCVDFTDFPGLGRRPLATAAGPLLVPIDREAIDLVWSARGYPAGAAYANTHAFTPHRHVGWANDGRAYDPARAAAQARADAADFARRVSGRVADGGLCVCAVDTEFFGHHWREGIAWLAEVIDACEGAGVRLQALDDALAGAQTAPAPAVLPVTTWGQPRTLATWSSPGAGGLAWQQRAAELAALAGAPSERALRELLALQASDWAFLISRGTAGPYPRERFEGHLRGLRAALAGPRDAALRGLAPHLAGWALSQP